MGRQSERRQLGRRGGARTAEAGERRDPGRDGRGGRVVHLYRAENGAVFVVIAVARRPVLGHLASKTGARPDVVLQSI